MYAAPTTAAKVLAFIHTYARANQGRVPTTREIVDGVGLKSSSTAHYAIERLTGEGRLRRVVDRKPAYAIVVTDCCPACGGSVPAELHA